MNCGRSSATRTCDTSGRSANKVACAIILHCSLRDDDPFKCDVACDITFSTHIMADVTVPNSNDDLWLAHVFFPPSRAHPN